MNRYEFYTRLDSYRRANPDEDKKDEIKHYGITGQKWGQRRWQYADGRFNPEGKERYFGSGKKTNNGVSDYLNYKKNSTTEPAKEFGDFPGLRGLKKAAKNLKEFKFGSTENPFERKTDKDYTDKNGNFDDTKYDADKQRAIKELDTKYDKDFANVIKDNYDTTGEWGDVDAEYAKFKENPYDYLRKYSRDPKYNISDKEEKQLIKEAAKLDKAIAKGNDSIAEIMLSDRSKNIKEEANNAFDKYTEEADKLKELFDDYDKDDQNEKITAITGFTNGLIYSDKLGDLANSVYGYVYDDFDQGAGNSGYIYMLEKGYSDNDIRNMCKSNYENTEKFKSDIDSIIEKDPLLGKLNKTNKIRLRNPISEGEFMNNNKIREYDDNSYRLQEVGEGMGGNYSENIHKNLPEAKKLYSKVEKACSGKEYGWWYFNKAVQDLGLTNVSYKDLTNADWDKINAKVSELAK